MKHVWILNHYAQVPNRPGGTRHYSLARHMQDLDWKTTVLAASTDHVTGAQRLADGEKTRLDDHDDVKFLWLRAREYAGNGTERILNMLDYTRAVLKPNNLEALERPDVIIGSSVHPLAAWAGQRLAKRYDVPFVFEVRDLWPQTLVDMGRLNPLHPATLALRWLEKSLCKSACKIITLLPKADLYFAGIGVDAGKVEWVPNGVDMTFWGNEEIERQPSSGFVVMYFGAVGRANDLGTLLKAMQHVHSLGDQTNIILRLIGDGPEKPSLEALAFELGLNNVQFEQAVSKSQIPAVASQADLFVICVSDLPGLYRFGISMNKIYDYMAAGRPVVIGMDAVNNPILEAGCGVSVPPEDPMALAQAILRIAKMPPSERQSMGVAGRRYVQAHYSMDDLASRLASTLEECVSRD